MLSDTLALAALWITRLFPGFASCEWHFGIIFGNQSRKPRGLLKRAVLALIFRDCKKPFSQPNGHFVFVSDDVNQNVPILTFKLFPMLLKDFWRQYEIMQEMIFFLRQQH